MKASGLSPLSRNNIRKASLLRSPISCARKYAPRKANPTMLITLMRQFVEKYPKNDKVYFAYESIAQTSINAGNTDAGLATYREFVERYPESPPAGDAMFKIADLQRSKAEALGRYSALSDKDRSQWNTLVEGSIAASEEAIRKYPDSASLAAGSSKRCCSASACF